ncbi:microspherule protein 1-like [Styela clava]|uniref:microspherule protein 1-like n=1 Tax=Styela clava TaxID=7725 RepID=UPI00193A3065|nr:microspherule protein 1-like [Styela clava]
MSIIRSISSNSDVIYTTAVTSSQSLPETPATSYSSKRTDRRRHSLRSIKRRKFDDEIVESSLASKGLRRSLDGSNPDEHHDEVVSPTLSVTATSPTESSANNDFSSSSKTGHITKLTASQSNNTGVMVQDRKDKKKIASHQRKRLKKTQKAFAAVKDMGRWKPTDDILLIDAIEQLGDLSLVHLGVKFSCHFTIEEVQERWYALLYDPVISSLARQAMKAIPREIVTATHAKAPFSKVEESHLCKIHSTNPPSLEDLQSLLDENIDSFHPNRTAQSMLNHWNLLHQYHLLDDQAVQQLPKGDHVLNFSDAEDLLEDNAPTGPYDQVLGAELNLADRRQKREIKQLEEENEKWKVLVSNVAETQPTSQFDEQTLGVLQGRLVRYLMRSKEITLGRKTVDTNVDVDLSLEGPASKVSRKQGTIKLKKNGEFVLINTGKRPIVMDGRPILSGNRMRLCNDSVIELGLLRFVFIINEDLVKTTIQKKPVVR